MKSARHCVLAACLPLLLLAGGCSGFLHSNAKAVQTYYLRATAAPASAAVPLPVALRVAVPDAAPGLDTARIVLVQPDHRMGFYAASQWPAPAPAMLEALTVQTLRAGGHWASVLDSGSPFPSDLLLLVTLRRFEADYSGGATSPEVHVVLDAILGRHGGNDVLGSFEAAGSAVAGANRMGEVVSAFEQATNQALGALAQQTLSVALASQDAAPQNGVRPAPSSSR